MSLDSSTYTIRKPASLPPPSSPQAATTPLPPAAALPPPQSQPPQQPPPQQQPQLYAATPLSRQPAGVSAAQQAGAQGQGVVGGQQGQQQQQQQQLRGPQLAGGAQVGQQQGPGGQSGGQGQPAPGSAAGGMDNSNAAPAAATAGGAATYPSIYLLPINDSFVPKIISLYPPGAGNKIKIGRQTNTKTVPGERNGYFDSKVLSRMHAEIWAEDGHVFIKDVKSSNGTFVNGHRLSPEAVESDVFELHTDDIVEFGIDITSDDTKMIVHHKVSTRVFLVFGQEDTFAANREFTAWYRNAELPSHLRRGGKGPGNPLTFDHVLNRLQVELQHSRDASAHLTTLTSTLSEVTDTLHGGPPAPLTSAPPLPTSFPSRGGGGGAQANAATHPSLQALQTQLAETQASLAGHVGKMRELEGMLMAQEGVKREVESLREWVDKARREMGRESGIKGLLKEEAAVVGGTRGRKLAQGNGRVSPVAALLEQEEDEEDDEDDDGRSVASAATIRERDEEPEDDDEEDGKPPLRSESSESDEAEASTSKKISLASEPSFTATLARTLSEENASLSSRVEALSAQLVHVTALAESLRQEQANSSAVIKRLESQLGGLERKREEGERKGEEWRRAFETSWAASQAQVATPAAAEKATTREPASSPSKQQEGRWEKEREELVRRWCREEITSTLWEARSSSGSEGSSGDEHEHELDARPERDEEEGTPSPPAEDQFPAAAAAAGAVNGAQAKPSKSSIRRRKKKAAAAAASAGAGIVGLSVAAGSNGDDSTASTRATGTSSAVGGPASLSAAARREDSEDSTESSSPEGAVKQPGGWAADSALGTPSNAKGPQQQQQATNQAVLPVASGVLIMVGMAAAWGLARSVKDAN